MKTEIAELQQSINDSYKTPQKTQNTAEEENDNLSEMSESGFEPIDLFA